MSISGFAGLSPRSYTARQMLELALKRAGVTPAQFTSEIVESAYDTFNLMLTNMLNLGIQLWGRDEVIVPLYSNRNQYPMPLGTSVVIDVRQRTVQRTEPASVASDAGGTPAYAFDNDFATIFEQTAADGSLTATYTSAVSISNIGIFFPYATVNTFFLEYDILANGNWQVLNTIEVDCQADTWVWQDEQGAPAALKWRLRVIGEAPMAITELVLGNLPNEIPMGVWNMNDWDAMPAKNTPGAPWNWYQDRQNDTPVLFVWPMPNDQCRYMTLVCRRRRYLQQLTDMSQTLDISQRWNEALTWELAKRLCTEVPEADIKRYGICKDEALQSLALAVGEERDPAPMVYNPGLDVYNF